MIPSLQTGGAESMAFQLAKAINKSRFNLQFICLYSSSGTTFEQELERIGVKIVFLEKGLGLNLLTFRKMWRALEEHQTEIVHSHLGACLYAAPWTLMRGKKLLHTVHNLPVKELPSLHRMVLRGMFKLKKAIPVSISDTIRQEISRFYSLHETAVPLVYNPVDLRHYHYKEEEKRQEAETIKFVCVARLAPQKNHKMLLKAFAAVQSEMENTRLVLAGEGTLMNQLKLLSEQLKISERVDFLGNVENIPELLKASDIFVLASSYEGLPLTILEAMGARLPVIATRVGGVPDIVKENGVLIEPDQPHKFAEAMLKLAKHKNLRERMGEQGFLMSSQYDIETISHKYEQLYITYCSSS